MSSLASSTFSKYQQTEQEQLAGSSYTKEQQHFIQTQIGMIAESIIALTPDPNNYAAFIQQESFLKGQLTAYQYLLDCSLESEKALLALAIAQAATS